MDRDEGYYQLPHIYDCLLSIVATPGGQSFRRRQQQLPKRQQQWNEKMNFDEFTISYSKNAFGGQGAEQKSKLS